jgi:transposase
VEIAKRNQLHTFAVIPKRWVVERSFAWLEKCRRLWKNCERKLNISGAHGYSCLHYFIAQKIANRFLKKIKDAAVLRLQGLKMIFQF